ncbi:MAG: hypothetical protein ACRD2W_24435 [Acidimicrobiales bacterium]
MRRLGSVAGGLAAAAIVMAYASTSWACVVYVGMRIDRQFVAPGGELTVSIAPAVNPIPTPVAIRLDRLDAPPLLTHTPSATGPTEVRVRIPVDASLGEHILIANDPQPPGPSSREVYLVERALFSVVPRAEAARNPTIETVFTFSPPLTYQETNELLATTGAQLVRLHYVADPSGDFVNADTTVGATMGSFQQQIGGLLKPGNTKLVVDTMTVRGRVEKASMGKFSPRVDDRTVVDLTPGPPAAVPAAAARDDSGDSGGGGGLVPRLVAAACVAVVLAGAAAFTIRNRRTT